MRLLSNRIIKIQQPIKRIVVLPIEKENNAPGSGEFQEGLGEQSAQEIEEKLQISQKDFQQEIQFAYEKGLEEGKLAGYQQAEADYREKIDHLNKVIQSIENNKQQVIQQTENLLLDFSLKLVERVVPEIPPFVKNLVQNSIEKVLQIISNEPIVTFYLNPADVQDINDLQNDLNKQLPSLEKIIIKKDPRIQRGGCIVETEHGKIDARIETQITKLIQELRKELKSQEKD